ncbi:MULTISPECIES: glycosyltransferase [unclassified Rhodococcus (in: high G+C Gram-positive bacteria)]|uniref:glycosyltransferase n=1 Tax=unclassified Rhodococcus (in: high G+C Gram-positive bacteria) TaxID=192944 RepID=UPI00211AABE8|nr:MULTISPECIES: glycosyltransferase [unclassified Rhodococcus (in: high G+C Gram-positive bacteria)]
MILRDCRLVYVAPRSGVGGVGDYADDFADAVRPHFAEVIEYRHEGPGSHSMRDILRHRKAIQELVDADPGRVIVHCELSGGSVMPFWATAQLTGDPVVTATVHDPPGLVWWPARTKFLAGKKVLNHGLHYPLRSAWRALERRVAGSRTLFALTRSGADSLAREYPDATAKASALFVPARPDITPAEERPLAVGLFGLVYRGKGFDQIHQLRDSLPRDIAIRIAGRGTELLDPVDGVEILGEVNGPDEDAFFASIRALVLPYGKRSIYGDAFPASSVVTRAIAYQTPVTCLKVGALAESDSGALVVDGGVDELADATAELITDPIALGKLRREVEALRISHTAELVVEDFVSVWAAQ